MDELVPKAEVAVTVNADALPTSVKDAFVPNTAPAPVPAQRSSHANAAKLESEKVVIAAPLSYAGSAARIWKLTGVSANIWARVGLTIAAILLVTCAWTFVTVWYITFGLLLVPYRLIRRGQRKNKRESLQHRELIAAVQSRD